jgi:hypothetical protein
MNLFDPVEGGDRQLGRLQIPKLLILYISDDGHYEADCITIQNPPHTINNRGMKHRKGQITSYMGMKLIPMMSIMDAWVCEPKATPFPIRVQ